MGYYAGLFGSEGILGTSFPWWFLLILICCIACLWLFCFYLCIRVMCGRCKLANWCKLTAEGKCNCDLMAACAGLIVICQCCEVICRLISTCITSSCTCVTGFFSFVVRLICVTPCAFIAKCGLGDFVVRLCPGCKCFINAVANCHATCAAGCPDGIIAWLTSCCGGEVKIRSMEATVSIKETTEEEQSQPLMRVERQVRMETKTDNQLIYAAYEVRPSSGIVTRGVVVSDERRVLGTQPNVEMQQTYMVEQPLIQQTYMVEQPSTMPSLQSELMPVVTQPSIGMQSYPTQTVYESQPGLYQSQMVYEAQPQPLLQPSYGAQVSDQTTMVYEQPMVQPGYGLQVGETQGYTTQQGGFVQQTGTTETYSVQQNYLAPGQMQPGFNTVYTTQPGP